MLANLTTGGAIDKCVKEDWLDVDLFFVTPFFVLDERAGLGQN